MVPPRITNNNNVIIKIAPPNPVIIVMMPSIFGGRNLKFMSFECSFLIVETMPSHPDCERSKHNYKVAVPA
jgi:hypothetical protein